MEKVKVTEKQAKAIKTLDGKEEQAVKWHIGGWANPEKAHLNSLSLDQFIRALYIGYEVEPEFTCDVGDWIKDTSTGAVLQIRDMQHRNNIMDKRYTTKRHATPEEIAEEKERRWWKKHDRDVWELRERDLLLDNYLKAVEVTAINDSMTGVSLNGHGHYGMSHIKELYKVICFAENRLDVKSNE